MKPLLEPSISALRRILWKGGAHTKRELSDLTGLSIATVNATLNDMNRTGEILAAGARHGGAGRTAQLYRANEAFSPVLAAHVDIDRGARVLVRTVLSVTGRVLDRDETRLPELDGATLVRLLGDWRRSHPESAQASVGIPGIVAEGVVSHCDLPELNGTDIVADLERELGVPALAANDMHLKAYGFFRELGDAKKTVTLANFPVGVHPGTATIANGAVVTGAGQFAGMVGFIPAGTRGALMAPDPEDFSKPCPELVAHALAAVVTALNPDIILCTGGLLDEDAALEQVRDMLEQWIPKEFVPHLERRDDLENCYLGGLLARALDARLSDPLSIGRLAPEEGSRI